MSYLSLTFLCEFRVYLSMEICTKKLQMEYLPTFLIHDRHLAKQEDDVNKKMIFKWSIGFCVSQSWQTREQLLAHLWGVNSPIPGPAVDCLGTGRLLHQLCRQQLWVNSLGLPSQPLAPHLHPSVCQVPEALGCLVCSPTSMPFSAKGIHLLSHLFVPSWIRSHRKVKTLTWGTTWPKRALSCEPKSFCQISRSALWRGALGTGPCARCPNFSNADRDLDKS